MSQLLLLPELLHELLHVLCTQQRCGVAQVHHDLYPLPGVDAAHGQVKLGGGLTHAPSRLARSKVCVPSKLPEKEEDEQDVLAQVMYRVGQDSSAGQEKSLWYDKASRGFTSPDRGQGGVERT